MADHSNPILESARQHRRELGMLFEIPVPEWKDADGNPLVIYHAPVSLENRRFVNKKNKEDPLGAAVDLIILKARDADGDRCFKPIDKKLLMSTEIDSEVVMRIAEEMVGETAEDEETGEITTTEPTAENARKNLTAIPSSS